MKNEGTEATLAALESLGFIFRIPGGKSRVGDHSSYCIIYRFIGSELELLLVAYNKQKSLTKPQDEEVFGEEIEGALKLKVIEQTGVYITEAVKIGEQKGKNNSTLIDSVDHIKHLFYADMYDDSNIRTGPSPNKRTDPPLWTEYERAKRYVCPQHQWMFVNFEDKVIMPRLKNF